MHSLALAPCLAAALSLTSCAYLPLERHGRFDAPRLDTAFIESNSSAPNLPIVGGDILSDNDDAFERKLALVRSARESIDLAYYIYGDDYSSSLLSRELLAATARGVDVRMLLDYHSHYVNLDQFLMLEHRGNEGAGSLQVRLYNRPTRNIIRDAVFLTLGCGKVNAGKKAGCSKAKISEIEDLFEEDHARASAEGVTTASKLYTANSGLFLSGLYAKNPNLMAMAVSRGQDVDVGKLRAGSAEADPAAREQLKELGELYWRANYGGGLDRVVNRLKLSSALLLHGDEIDPVFDAFSAYLPVERDVADSDSRRDWSHLSDFLHHKVLLIDGRALVIGGRNVQDAYHMNPSELSAKYTFMDTDVHLELTDGDAELLQSFDRLWDFEPMVATLDDVRQHAPNEFLAESRIADAACEAMTSDIERHRTCLARELSGAEQITLETRLESRHDTMMRRAARYESEYKPRAEASRGRRWAIDPAATVHYVENLPFAYADDSIDGVGMRDADVVGRQYGGRNDDEADSGKHLSALWLAAMNEVCSNAIEGERSAIYLHNAYFFLPSNLLSRLARMVDGRLSCANVDIVVLTNSIETTDLNVVNALSGHALQALFEHYEKRHDPRRGATLAYHEYLPDPDAANLSLHSKIMVFGDDLFIGSANADFRSYLMDTNNGVLIRDQPELTADYVSWLHTLLDDPARTVRRDSHFQHVTRDDMLAEGDRLVDATFAKYRAERFVDDPDQRDDLKQRLRELADEAYRLSRLVVAGSGDARQAQERLDGLFKAI